MWTKFQGVSLCIFLHRHTHTSTVSVNIGLYFSFTANSLLYKSDTSQITCEYHQRDEYKLKTKRLV